MVSSKNEMKLETFLVLDLVPMAKQIVRHFGDLLEPPPAGIYRADSLEPVMRQGEQYFVKVNDTFVPIADINTVKTSVYDKFHRTVIPASYMKNRANMLSDTPFDPYRGVHIAEVLLSQHIDNFVSWRSSKINHYEKLRRHFRADAFDAEEFDEVLLDLHFKVTDDLSEWLGEHHWNIFLSNRKGTSLRIERYEDYRIHDWMQRFKQGEIKL